MARQWRYRNFHQNGNEQLCVMGLDLVNEKAGVLEFCVDRFDARCLLRFMEKKFVGQFQDLHIGKIAQMDPNVKDIATQMGQYCG